MNGRDPFALQVTSCLGQRQEPSGSATTPHPPPPGFSPNPMPLPPSRGRSSPPFPPSGPRWMLIPSDFVVHSFRPPMEEAMSRLWSQLG